MATSKTPAKGKKPAAPKEKGTKRAPKATAKPAAVEDEESSEGDEDEDDDLDLAPAKPAAKKPAPAPAAKATSGDPPAVVPARRLTPEAKAKVNEMVAKGMPLGDALKAAAAWETFVAPVKDEPAKLVQGKSFEGHPRPRRPAGDRDDDGAVGGIDADEEPMGSAEAED
jgi:hypothetical protein